MQSNQTTIADLAHEYTRQQSVSLSRSDRYMLRALKGRDKIAFVPVADLKPADLVQFRDRMAAADKSPQTIHHYMMLIRRLIRVARVEWDRFDIPDHRDTFSLVKLPRVDNARDRRLRAGEWDALLSHSDDALRAFLSLALETAMRRGEICALLWQMVDWEHRIVTLPGRHTKSRRGRQVPLSRAAMAILEGLRPGGGDVPAIGSVFGLSANAVTLRYRRARAKAARGCPSVATLRLHDLRHECLTRLAERGFTLPQLRVVSGHSDFRVLRRYVNLTARDLVDKMG